MGSREIAAWQDVWGVGAHGPADDFFAQRAPWFGQPADRVAVQALGAAPGFAYVDEHAIRAFSLSAAAADE
jgi:hypothetical protein